MKAVSHKVSLHDMLVRGALSPRKATELPCTLARWLLVSLRERYTAYVCRSRPDGATGTPQ
jgi:hypothetical protein